MAKGYAEIFITPDDYVVGKPLSLVWELAEKAGVRLIAVVNNGHKFKYNDDNLGDVVLSPGAVLKVRARDPGYLKRFEMLIRIGRIVRWGV